MNKKYSTCLLTGTVLAALCWSSGVIAASQYDSSYTSIRPANCRTISSDIESGSVTQRCPSFRNIGVTVEEGDARQSITLTVNGHRYPLDFWTRVTPSFSSLGNVVEWRHQRGRPDKLAGMIVRLNAEDGSGSSRDTSYLVVVKVTPQAVCVVDKVEPQVRQNQNVKARGIAERAAELPCL